MFRYERVNSTRKFTIVAEIVSLLRKIYERDGPLRAMFKVKTLAVLFPPYPREMKTNTAKFKSAAILALVCFYGNGAIHSHARARGLSMRTHLTAVDSRAPCLGAVQKARGLWERDCLTTTPRQNALRMSTNLSFRSITHFRLPIEIQCKQGKIPYREV